MRRIINGLRYDTETATEVATYGNDLGGNDFRYLNEELYITKKGNWFLKYDGGAMSKYSVSEGNMHSSSSGIAPMTPDEAYYWLEKNDETEALETYFSDNIEEA